MKKKGHGEEHENLERWLVSYADFITLLFAFFTVMYALSMSDKNKYKEAMKNISDAFMSAGGLFPLSGHPFVALSAPPSAGAMTSSDAPAAADQSAAEEAAAGRMRDNLEGLFQRTTGVEAGRGAIAVVKTERGFRIRISEHLLFKPGGDKLQRRSIPFLYQIGQHLARLGAPVQIEGYTDNTPLKDGRSNWQLSLDRAYHVGLFFVEALQFPQDKLSLAGFGDTHPLARNESEAGRAQNRRVELSVSAPDAALYEVW